MDHYPVNTKFLKSTNSAILNGVFTWLTKISECDLLFYKKKIILAAKQIADRQTSYCHYSKGKKNCYKY